MDDRNSNSDEWKEDLGRAAIRFFSSLAAMVPLLGAALAFSYAGERFKERITDFAAEFDSTLVFDCDVASDEQIAALFKDLSCTWPTFDGFVHSIGFAPREAIAGNFLDGLSRENYATAHRPAAHKIPTNNIINKLDTAFINLTSSGSNNTSGARA